MNVLSWYRFCLFLAGVVLGVSVKRTGPLLGRAVRVSESVRAGDLVNDVIEKETEEKK